MKIILFNGPPGSGKDTAVHLLTKHLMSRSHKHFPLSVKFSQPLKEAAHALVGLKVDYDHFEGKKDEPSDIFLGMTPREFYISLAEKYAKKFLKKDIFTDVLLRRCDSDAVWLATHYIEEEMEALFLCSDIGFNQELEGILHHFGYDNVRLIKLYRPYKDYTNDSRGYVNGVVKTKNIHNDWDLETFEIKLIRWLEEQTW